MACKLPQIMGFCSLIALFALLVLLPMGRAAEQAKKAPVPDLIKQYFDRLGFLPDKKRQESIIQCCTKAAVPTAAERCSYKWRLAQLTKQADTETNFTLSDSPDYRDALKSVQALFNEGVRDTPVVRQRLADAKASVASMPAIFQRVIDTANANTTRDAPTQHFHQCPSMSKAQITLLECCQAAKVPAECLALCDSDVLKRNAAGDGLANAELHVAQMACTFKAQKSALDCMYTD